MINNDSIENFKTYLDFQPYLDYTRFNLKTKYDTRNVYLYIQIPYKKQELEYKDYRKLMYKRKNK